MSMGVIQSRPGAATLAPFPGNLRRTMNDERELKLGNIRDLDVDAEPAAQSEPRRGPARQTEAAARPSSEAVAKKPAADGTSVWMASTAFLLVLVLVLEWAQGRALLLAVVRGLVADQAAESGNPNTRSKHHVNAKV